MNYSCTCGRKYTTPIPLSAAPTCSGNKSKHTPRTMKEES